MPALFFTCPKTQRRAPTGIETDVQSLRSSWSKKLKVNCSLCGQVHEMAVREVYTDGVLWEATDAFRRA
jgi:hypothetical protein